MAQPRRTTVTIDGNAFQAITAGLGMTTEYDSTGMLMMGSAACSIDLQVDANDMTNMPFATLRSLFNLANLATRDKVKHMQIDFWTDEQPL